MSPTTPAPATSAAVGTQTLHRAVALLRLITAHNRTGSRLVDLYRRTGLERPTAHRILQGMIAEQLIRQDSKSKRYYLGSLLYEMGLAAAPKLALRDICHPYLEAIAEHTGDTVFMTVRSGFDGVCVARADGSFPIKMFVHDVGRHRPLNVGAGGLAVLSALPDEDVQRICRINVERTRRKNPRFTEAQLRASIAATRRRGYATNKVMDDPPVHSVGLVVRYPDGSPAAGISVSTLASRLGKDRLEMVVRCLGDAVESIEAELRKHIERGRDV
ncbi:IclR family transcriptional regulator [Bordetella genomosp. 9]|uniref:IclR family transcriptional regulator n=1 Tax=Bordetella genomosp. 9 TaxID=1416803 RepID=UPI000A296803|nr:IclR family transcriptional regulator [Bordetella genomosp. 9]ARP89148.1 IclR family transcriptional regulator [Bordetella genomosp. 9]